MSETHGDQSKRVDPLPSTDGAYLSILRFLYSSILMIMVSTNLEMGDGWDIPGVSLLMNLLRYLLGPER